MVENPFRFGKVVSGKYFTDREREYSELVGDLEGGQNLIVYSPRKYGKTSLILKVLDGLARKGIGVAYIDLFEVTTLKHFAEKFVGEVLKNQNGSAVVGILKKFLPRMSPKLVIGDAVKIEVELSRAEKELDEVLDLPEHVSAKSGRRMVVVIDEFQEINNLDGGRMESLMRSKFQRHTMVSYVFMGSKRHLFEPIFAERERPFFRFGKQFSLGKIPRDEFASFIRSRFADTGKNISDEAIKSVLDMTDGHPYYTQQICHEMWNIAEKNVAGTDVGKALAHTISDYSYSYELIWDSLRGHARSLLFGLAVGSDNIYSAGFISKYGLGAPTSVQKALKTLEKKGLVEKTADGRHAVEDVFFAEWLRKTMQ